MEGLLAIWNAVVANKKEIIDAIAYLVLFASVVVKVTPTLKDDNRLKSFVKFIGKYIALDKYGPNGEK